jgi:hypothetical protein
VDSISLVEQLPRRIQITLGEETQDFAHFAEVRILRDEGELVFARLLPE